MDLLKLNSIKIRGIRDIHISNYFSMILELENLKKIQK